MSIFTIAVNEAEVADLRFADGLTPEGFAPRNGIEHLDLAVELVQRKAEVASIIVVVSPLEQELWDNPRFATWTAQIGSCEARVEARRRLMTQKFGPVEVTARARELGFPLAGSSAAEADVNNVDVGDTRSPSYPHEAGF